MKYRGEKMQNEKMIRLRKAYDYVSLITQEKVFLGEGNVADKIEIYTENSEKSEKQLVLNKNHHRLRMVLNCDDYESVPYAIVAFADFEKKETEMIRRMISMLPRDIICYDIGANEGWYTLHIMKDNPKAKVYSFEPGPITFTRLKNNMVINGLKTDNCVNMGLFNKEDKMEFFYDPHGSGASSMVNLREKESIKKLFVDVTTLDSWTEKQEIERLDFIKCDVEGSELFVYQGGKETINRYKPIVFTEMLRKWSARFGYHPNDIIKFFAEIGYGCFVIGGDSRLKEINEVTEETIETNYFFLHLEKHDDIICQIKE